MSRRYQHIQRRDQWLAVPCYACHGHRKMCGVCQGRGFTHEVNAKTGENRPLPWVKAETADANPRS